MKLFEAATTVCCVAAMGAVLAPGAKSRRLEPEDHDHVQRSRGDPRRSPQRLGRVCPPARTYSKFWIRSPTATSSRSSTQDETTIYATILAIPNYRLKATDKTVMTFTERPAGEPEALRAWFYPGRNWGEEFVYPKARAIELAKSTNTPVLYTPVEIPLEVAEPIKSVDEPVVLQLKAGTHHGHQADRRRSCNSLRWLLRRRPTLRLP